MWASVRGAVTDLTWGGLGGAAADRDLLGEWSATVDAMLAVERALHGGGVTDALSRLASATRAAASAGRDVEPVRSPSLQPIRDALGEVERQAREQDREGEPEATLTHVAYELVHWVRVLHPPGPRRDWLMAAENFLDAVVHRPQAQGAGTTEALTAWQSAVAAVYPLGDNPVVRRGVRLGHLPILHATHRAASELARQGALPAETARRLLAATQEMASEHQRALAQTPSRRMVPDRRQDAIRLRLGEAVGQLSIALRSKESPDARLDALLRSEVGWAPFVATITGGGRKAAQLLQGAAWEYMVGPVDFQLPPTAVASAQVPARDVNPAVGAAIDRLEERGSTAPPEAPVPRVEAGMKLDGEVVRALCLTRDTAAAARRGEADHPLLAGVDRSRWPELIEAGRLAVADLVEAVRPVAFVALRGRVRSADSVGDLFEVLTKAAHRYDPNHEANASWSTYAWACLHQHARAIPRVVAGGWVRDTDPRSASLEQVFSIQEPADPGPAPVDYLSMGELVDAVAGLPDSLRDALVLSVQGHAQPEIAERIGTTQAGVQSRLARARTEVAKQIGYDPRGRGVSR